MVIRHSGNDGNGHFHYYFDNPTVNGAFFRENSNKNTYKYVGIMWFILTCIFLEFDA